jgi:fructuronate reductase
VPIRFGETIKSYIADPTKDVTTLTAIPLAIAGWLRYLLAVDDEGKEMPVSADPMLPALQAELAGVELGKPESCKGKLDGILRNVLIFAVDLKEAGLAEKIEGYLSEMLAGPGAVRAALKKYLG